MSHLVVQKLTTGLYRVKRTEEEDVEAKKQMKVASRMPTASCVCDPSDLLYFLQTIVCTLVLIWQHLFRTNCEPLHVGKKRI
jgi:hypothetical protein